MLVVWNTPGTQGEFLHRTPVWLLRVDDVDCESCPRGRFRARRLQLELPLLGDLSIPGAASLPFRAARLDFVATASLSLRSSLLVESALPGFWTVPVPGVSNLLRSGAFQQRRRCARRPSGTASLDDVRLFFALASGFAVGGRGVSKAWLDSFQLEEQMRLIGLVRASHRCSATARRTPYGSSILQNRQSGMSVAHPSSLTYRSGAAGPDVMTVDVMRRCRACSPPVRSAVGCR